MEMASHRKTWLRGLVVFMVLGAAGGVGYYYYLHRDDPPRPAEVDVAGEDHNAGKVEALGGTILTRSIQAGDLEQVALTSPAPAPTTPGWTPLRDQGPIYLNTLFHVPAKQGVRLSSHGQWLFSLEGEGEYAFEDARIDRKKNLVTNVFFVRQGTFRAKPHDYDPREHWLEIRTPAAKVLIHQGEIGMRISPGGHGTVWLMQGKGVVVTPDGRRRELSFRGMDHI